MSQGSPDEQNVLGVKGAASRLEGPNHPSEDILQVGTSAMAESSTVAEDVVGISLPPVEDESSVKSSARLERRTTRSAEASQASITPSKAEAMDSQRPAKKAGDLRSSFLEAVGNTISLAEPLGVPTINHDETSSSSGEETEAAAAIPRPRQSSILRAGHAALSLSKPSVSATADSPAKHSAPGSRGGGETARSTAGLRSVPQCDISETLGRFLHGAPAYPNGCGGTLLSSRAPGPRTTGGKVNTGNYRFILDHPKGEVGTLDVPWGVEAVFDEASQVLAVRELTSPNADLTRPRSDRCDTFARIIPTPAPAGGREAEYVMVLEGLGEVMAVKIKTHPTRLAAPRETRVIALLPSQRGTVHGEVKGLCAWQSPGVMRSDSLWEAAEDGRIDDVAEFRNKKAAWSSTLQAFEIPLLEAWRVGGTSSNSRQQSPQSAPETMQMVATPKREDGGRTARSQSSSERESRVPCMQLVRFKGSPRHEDVTGAGYTVDDISWHVAIAAPMPVLYGFCLAVIALETAIIGAPVRMVDRSAARITQEAAAGFLGFDKALIVEDGQSPRKPNTDRSSAASTGSARSSRGQSVMSARLNASAGVSPGGSASSAKRDAYRARGGHDPSSDGIDFSGGNESSDQGRGAQQAIIAEQTSSFTAAGTATKYNTANADLGNNDAEAICDTRGEHGDNQTYVRLSASNVEAAEYELGDEGASCGADDHTSNKHENADRGGRGHGGEGPHAASSTVPIPVKRRMSVQIVAAKIVEKVHRNTYVCNLCLITLVVAFATDLYPGAPAHNGPLSAALLWASCNVDTVRALRRRSFAYALSALVLISLFIDIDFLASTTKVYALDQLEDEDDDLPRVIVGKNMHVFGQMVVGGVAVLKAVSWQGILATSPQGVHALNLLWRRFKLFLPIWGSPRKLTKEVYNRLVGLAWIHLLGAMALTTMAGVAALGFGWAPQFASSEGAGAPLTVICLIKSVTGLLVSAAFFRNMDLALCLNVFGCLACFQGWHLAREERRRARHGVTYPKVILEWDYIMLCGYLKIFDLLVGLWLWIGLGWSWSEDRDYSERHSIRMLLVAISTVQTLTDVWCVFLGITVSLLVSQHLLRKERMAEAARNAFGDGSDHDVEASPVVGKRAKTCYPRLIAPQHGHLLATPPTSPSLSSTGDEVPSGRRTGSDSVEERGDEMESDDDSYNTGPSDTYDDEGSEDGRTSDGNRGSSGRRSTVSAMDLRYNEEGSTPCSNTDGGSAIVTAQPETSLSAPTIPQAPPRRRSMFAPGGNRLVYKRAFSARSSSDDSVIGGADEAASLPDTLTLDRTLAVTAQEFGAAWDMLETCASFRCRIGRMPEVETMASHFRDQGFLVIASGAVFGRTKIYTCARGIGLDPLFFAELVFEKEMHELEFTFKCRDGRLTSRFVCHMHLRKVIGDHQPIA